MNKPKRDAARAASVRRRVSAAEWQLRCELAAAHRLVAHFVFAGLTYNDAASRDWVAGLALVEKLYPDYKQ
ncbi:MAG: hypothetical protein ABI790_16390 [Betaproteobacteria bacterium]